jgi:hypothetical protein
MKLAEPELALTVWMILSGAGVVGLAVLIIWLIRKVNR